MKQITLDELYSKMRTVENYPKEGVSFKDIIPLIQDPDLRYQLICYIIDTIPDDVDVIVAPETRGLMLASIVADGAGKELLMLRKKGKIPVETYYITYDTEYSTDVLEVERQDLEEKNCWFIDDIYATGGTYKAAKSLVDKCKGVLTGGTILLGVLDKKPRELVELFCIQRINELNQEVE